MIAAALLLAMTAILTIRHTGVREIHRAQESVNFAVMDARPAQGDWPWWQGATQSSTAPMESPPVQWSSSDTTGWVVPVTGRGRGAICIWGEQLFLPTIDVGREAVSMSCLDHTTGRTLWQTEVCRGGSMPLQPRHSQASTTPACDGTHVFVACPIDGSLCVTALDLHGQIAWQREAGPYFSKGGYSSSPAIYKSLVIVAADNKGARIHRLMGTSYLAALHRHTGEIVWRIHRPEADSFGTPVVANIAGRDQLLMAGKGKICSYNPMTGASLWTCQWSAERVANSVAFDDQNVYASARQPRQELLCVRADGTGDVSRTHVVWRGNKSASEIPSPVVFEGRLYTATDDGVLACLEAGTGQVIWKRRVGGNICSSPMIAGRHLFCGNEDGTVFVFGLGGRGELVAEIPVGEGILASPVVSRGRMFLRTLQGLRCVTPREEAPLASQPESSRRRL